MCKRECKDLGLKHRLGHAVLACITNQRLMLQGDYVVLASEPVCICGVDCAAPQQLRGRGKARMSVAELKAIFGKQFTPYEVRRAPETLRRSLLRLQQGTGLLGMSASKQPPFPPECARVAQVHDGGWLV